MKHSLNLGCGLAVIMSGCVVIVQEPVPTYLPADGDNITVNVDPPNVTFPAIKLPPAQVSILSTAPSRAEPRSGCSLYTPPATRPLPPMPDLENDSINTAEAVEKTLVDYIFNLREFYTDQLQERKQTYLDYVERCKP